MSDATESLPRSLELLYNRVLLGVIARNHVFTSRRLILVVYDVVKEAHDMLTGLSLLILLHPGCLLVEDSLVCKFSLNVC